MYLCWSSKVSVRYSDPKTIYVTTTCYTVVRLSSKVVTIPMIDPSC
jgi:hypothetical protein